MSETEGVVKYTCHFSKSRPLKPSLIRPIESCRARLYAMGLIGAYPDGIGYGNISQRVGQSDTFVITGTQTGHLNRLTPKHYSLVEECDDRGFCLSATGAVRPSSEALTHGTIYGLSPDITAVIHVHSMVLWKSMLSGDYLHTEKVPYGTIEMVEETERLYQDISPLSTPCFAMAGHEEGIICFGRDMDEAEQVLYEILRAYLANISHK